MRERERLIREDADVRSGYVSVVADRFYRLRQDTMRMSRELELPEPLVYSLLAAACERRHSKATAA